MEVLLSAVASDIVGRLVSFLISKFQEPAASTVDDDVVRLQRALLRARVVIEEAEARQVTNLAMLLQLNQLRAHMCRGSYVLDAFTRQAAVDPSPSRGSQSHAMASRRRSPAAGLPEHLESGRTRTGGGRAVSAAVNTLEAALSDMKEEFVVLLAACPHLDRQPYCAYLFMERCMFGRQMEKEQIISFLIQPSTAQDDLDVLPIIGPHEIGKRTLVEHACLDDRVRDHFAKIHRLRSEDLDLQSHDFHDHHQGLMRGTAARSLFVVDLAGDEGGDEEERWTRFRSCLRRRRAHEESKTIIISRTERHSALGTVPPLRLRAPRREQLWYLFRALSFGGADPEERPELVRMAMALFNSIPHEFAAANNLAAALRADLSASSWRRMLKVFAGVMELHLGAAARGGGPHRRVDMMKTTGYYCPSVPVKDAPRPRPNAPCLFYGERKSTGKARSELPKVTMMEVVVEGVVARGEKPFDVLVWQSRIPPYASYVVTCDMERAADVAVVGMKRRLVKTRRGHQQNVGG